MYRGRFAVVKKCLQKCSNQYVSVKYLNRRQTRKEEVEMEFNILHLLQHENLVQLYDLYETASNLLIVMELWVNTFQCKKIFQVKNKWCIFIQKTLRFFEIFLWVGVSLEFWIFRILIYHANLKYLNDITWFKISYEYHFLLYYTSAPVPLPSV